MTALVVGAARSGIALATHLIAAGESVRVVDRKPAAELQDEIAHMPGGVHRRRGGERGALEGAATVDARPGVPWDSPLLNAARAGGIAVPSETHLSLKLNKGRGVGIGTTHGGTPVAA